LVDIFLIIGLPGSGKTHYANTVLRHLPLVDDISYIKQLPLTGDFVLTDVNFCDHKVLEMAESLLKKKYPDASIHRIYFENDPDKARANVDRRNDGRRVNGTINRFAPIYRPPSDAIKIFSDR
jgi:hypothetical protein